MSNMTFLLFILLNNQYRFKITETSRLTCLFHREVLIYASQTIAGIVWWNALFLPLIKVLVCNCQFPL